MARDGSSPPRHAAGALGHPGPPSTARRCPGSCRNCPCSPQTPFTSQEILPLFWFICFFIVFVSVIRMTCAKQYLIEHFLMMYFSTFFFFGGGGRSFKSSKKDHSTTRAAPCRRSVHRSRRRALPKPGFPPDRGTGPAGVPHRFCLRFADASLGLLPCPGQVPGPEFHPGSRRITAARRARAMLHLRPVRWHGGVSRRRGGARHMSWGKASPGEHLALHF